MKNFSISCAVAELAVSLAMIASSTVTAADLKGFAPEELTNFFLSPEYSQWLVGPIARIASPEEVRGFLELQEDRQATAFIEEFWNRRGGDSVFPTKSIKLVFQERAEEADRLFSEATYRGRRTDRGTIYVLYGAPEEIRYELPTRQHGEPIEVWSYPKSREKGLDDTKPDRLYQFVKQGDVTVRYRGPLRRQRLRLSDEPGWGGSIELP